MSETKALQKQSFQKSSQERGEARPWIVKLWERPLDKGFCSLYSTCSWLRTHNSSSKAFRRRWMIRNLFLEVSPFWSRNTKGHTFLKWVFWGLQGVEKVFSWTDESSFRDVINLTSMLWLRLRILPRVLHLCFSCVLWLLGNTKQKVFGFLCGRATFTLLWSTIQATNPFL